MTDPRDYKLDVSSLPKQEAPPDSGARPYLSVLFDCCGVYQRVYRDPSGTSYSGRCPKCGNPVKFTVGADGTDIRFFRVS